MTLLPFQYQCGDSKFGRDLPIIVSKVDIQTYNVNNQDFQVQRSDENRFGIDTLSPAPIIFTMSVLQNYMLDNGSPWADVVEPSGLFAASENKYLNALAKEWKDPPLRLTWGATKPILFCDRNNRTVRIYGRPGKFTHSPRNRDGDMWIDVQAEFRRSDTYAHSDIEYFVGDPDSNDILAPGDHVTATRLDGDGDSWLRILIYGPATNPVITYGDDVIQTNSVIPPGVVAEISSYPWMRRYVDSTNVNRRTEIIGDTLYLDQIKFYEGETRDVSWTCTGSTADTGIYFLWREAYNVI